MNFAHITNPLQVSAGNHTFSAPIPNYNEVTALPNTWFRQCRTEYNNERSLYDSLVTEAYNKHGVCMTYYIVDFSTGNKPIFGEDNDKNIIRKFEAMGYCELPLEETIANPFGIEGIDNFEIHFSIRHFNEASRYDSEQIYPQYDSHIPIEGDLLQLQYSTYFLEVVHVRKEVEQFLQGKHSYTLLVRPIRDEHQSLSSDTSATMDEISALMNVRFGKKVGNKAEGFIATIIYVIQGASQTFLDALLSDNEVNNNEK
jgi:hypothetical protein